MNQTIPKRDFKAAVLLAGSGVYDGSECTEATSLLIALGKHKAEVQCFAPNRDQFHVINHLNGEEMKQTRNVMEESARIARGQVKALTELKSADFDAVFMPGGFGAAKNFSDFAVKGGDMTVQEDVSQVLKDFHAAQKYIGLCCIAPVVAAKVFGTKSGGPGAKLTLGCKGDDWPYNGAIDAATSFGNELAEKDINEVCVDAKNKIVSAPAYMKGNATFAEVYASVQKMVDEVAIGLGADKPTGLPITLIINLEIGPSKLDDFLKIMKMDAEGSRAEPGCLRFDMLQDPDASNKFTLYEVYKDEDAIEFHRNTPHYKAWAEFKEIEGAVLSVSKAVNKAVNFTF